MTGKVYRVVDWVWKEVEQFWCGDDDSDGRWRREKVIYDERFFLSEEAAREYYEWEKKNPFGKVEFYECEISTPEFVKACKKSEVKQNGCENGNRHLRRDSF